MVNSDYIGLFVDHKKHIFGPKEVEFGQIIICLNSISQIQHSDLVELVKLVKFNQIRNLNSLFQIQKIKIRINLNKFFRA